MSTKNILDDIFILKKELICPTNRYSNYLDHKIKLQRTEVLLRAKPSLQVLIPE